jgi:hypothetical protein
MDELGRVDPRGALIKPEAGIQYVLVAAIIPVALIPAIITLVQTGADRRASLFGAQAIRPQAREPTRTGRS